MSSDLCWLAVSGGLLGLIVSAIQALPRRRYLRELIVRNREIFDQISPRSEAEFLDQLKTGRAVVAVKDMWS